VAEEIKCGKQKRQEARGERGKRRERQKAIGERRDQRREARSEAKGKSKRGKAKARGARCNEEEARGERQERNFRLVAVFVFGCMCQGAPGVEPVCVMQL
jgi:hypothetical protein